MFGARVIYRSVGINGQAGAKAAILVVAPKRKVVKALREDRFIFEAEVLEPDDVASMLGKLDQKLTLQ